MSAAARDGEVRIGQQLFRLRDLTAQDSDEFLALHRRVFGSDGDEDWYRWKYAGGHGLATGMWHEGRLLAHCGGLPRNLWRDGRPVRGMQIGDVMVAPECRGILTRRGPFFRVSHGFYSAHVGKSAGVDIAFGFPSERHLRLAVLLELLWDGGPIHALSWLPHAGAKGLPSWSWHWRELDAADRRFDAQVNAAWERMRIAAAGLTLGERRADYVRWRYCERPNRRCRFFVLRRPWSDKPTGIAVLDLEQPDAQWLDWIGEPGRIATASRGCVAEAARRGARTLQAWASPLVAQSLQHCGIARQSVTAWLGIPRASALSAQDLPSLRWWLMGGDTDFL